LGDVSLLLLQQELTVCNTGKEALLGGRGVKNGHGGTTLNHFTGDFFVTEASVGGEMQ